MKAAYPTEHQDQVSIVSWANLQAVTIPALRMLFAVPNGARTSVGTAKKLVAEGLKKGVPDLWLPVPLNGYHGLVIEMKRQRGGVLSREQEWWLRELTGQGYSAHMAEGFDEARRIIMCYLGEVCE